MEEPLATEAVTSVFFLLRRQGLDVQLNEATFFVGTERVVPARDEPWTVLFSIMARNAQKATDFFRLPRDRVIEISTQIELSTHANGHGAGR